MTRSLKRIGGAVAVAVGLAGTVLSALALVQTRTTADRLGGEIPQALGDLEGIVASIHQQGTATVTLLGTARERAVSISAAIADLAQRAEQQPDGPSLLETLDEDIGRRLENAEEFVISMQISMRTMSSALLVLDSLPFFSPRVAPPGGAQHNQLRSAAEGLAETANLLDQVNRAIDRTRAGQAISPQQLRQLQETLHLVDRSLEGVQSEVHEFTRRVEQSGSKLAALRDDAPGWIHTAAAVATVFFVCFGFSQLSLLLHGWRGICASARNGTPARNGGQAAEAEIRPGTRMGTGRRHSSETRRQSL